MFEGEHATTIVKVDEKNFAVTTDNGLHIIDFD